MKAQAPSVAILPELARIEIPAILPLHPRTATQVTRYDLGHLLAGIRVVDPLEYVEFLTLLTECAVTRLVDVGNKIADAVHAWLGDVEVDQELAHFPCPYGDGSASLRSVALIAEVAGSAST